MGKSRKRSENGGRWGGDNGKMEYDTSRASKREGRKKHGRGVLIHRH